MIKIRPLFTLSSNKANHVREIPWVTRRSEIKKPDGTIVWSMDGVHVPASWSQTATDILASKYCRKAGVPVASLPSLDKEPASPGAAPVDGLGHEFSAYQVCLRIASAIAKAGVSSGYFTATGGGIFEAELLHILVHQIAAFNSPVWFNCGLSESYGIQGKGGNWVWDPVAKKSYQVSDGYERPQCSACFILRVDDSLDSITALQATETTIFRYGSGAGANFSAIRGRTEKLSSGGHASGMMSFLRVLDRSAGAIKSGGTCLAPHQKIYTQRGPVPVAELATDPRGFVVLSYDPPAGRYKAKRARAWLSGQKNVVRVVTDKGSFELSDDHPVKLSSGEYVQAGTLRLGASLFACSIDSASKLQVEIESVFGSADTSLGAVSENNHRVVRIETVGVMDVYDVEVECPTEDDKSPKTGHNFVIWSGVDDVGSGVVVANTRRAAKLVCVDMDHPEIEDFITWKQREEDKAQALIDAGYSSHYEGEAYDTISGQNANNSVRVTDAFMRAVEQDGVWSTTERTTGKVVQTYSARYMWRKVAESAWRCADPGVQYDTTMNIWNTVPNFDRIEASNPCGEYLHPSDTACNLASLNLTKFLRQDGSFDLESYLHTIDIMFLAQEILVGLSSYPTAKIAENSYKLRPLGIGYANLGALLMRLGLPYDSDAGRAWAGALTAILTGHAYRLSSQMAKELGAFEHFVANRDPMLRVMGLHRDAAYGIDKSLCPADLYETACEIWSDVVALGAQHGFRNSQASVLAPTGTIALLMDCDTTGVEPDFALVKHKKLAGGGDMVLINQSVLDALRQLGYGELEIQSIFEYVVGTRRLPRAVFFLSNSELDAVNAALAGAYTLADAFSPTIVGLAAYERMGVDPAGGGAALLPALCRVMWPSEDLEELERMVLGCGNVEGAPDLKPEHYAVFDCASAAGKNSTRCISPLGHLKMLAAVQPFISGGISKTIGCPTESTVEQIEDIYFLGWKMGLKSVALYRDKSKSSQPLNAKTKKEAPTDPAPARVQERAPEAPAATPATEGPTLVRDGGYGPVPAKRCQLPSRVSGYRQKARVDNAKLYLHVGLYPDGHVGEIFLDMHKEGSTLNAMMGLFASSVSIGLQHGVPLSTYVDRFLHTKFEPAGLVQGDPDIKLATSIVDWVFSHLAVNHLGRRDLAHISEQTAKDLADAYEPTPEQRDAAGLRPDLGQPRASGVVQVDGAVCRECGNQAVRRGTCWCCTVCGVTTGCG